METQRFDLPLQRLPTSNKQEGDVLPRRMVDNPVERVDIPVAGMTCVHCAQRMTQALRQTPGAVAAHVNSASAQAEVEYLPALVDFQGLQRAVEASGYEAVEPPPVSEEGVSQEETERQQEYRTLMRKFWFATIISIPVMLFSYPDLIPVLRDWMPMGSIERRTVHALSSFRRPSIHWARKT